MKPVESPRIINFGSINIDHVYTTREFVNPGETLAVEKYAIFAGGKGLNQSIAMARAGANVQHVGNTGVDGSWLVALMKAEGIDTSLVNQLEEPTGHAIIEVDGTGENRILVVHGANHRLSAAQLETALRGGPGLVLVQNEINLVPDILQQAKAAGHVTALNAAPCDAKLARISFQAVDILIVNRLELAVLSGRTDQSRGIQCLQERNPAVEIVVTLGSEGATVVSGAERWHMRAAPVEAVDTTGAGDTFVGYYLSGRSCGRPIPDCLRRACHASALAVRKKGAAPSIPGAAEVGKFMDDRNPLC